MQEQSVAASTSNKVIGSFVYMVCVASTVAAEYDLAVACGFGMMAWCLPAALDAYVLVAFRERRDIALAVGVLLVMVAASHLLSSGFLEMSAWVVIGVSSVAPLILWRVHGLLWGAPAKPVETAVEDTPPAPLQAPLERLQVGMEEPPTWELSHGLEPAPAEWEPLFSSPPAPLQDELEAELEKLEEKPIDQETLVEKLVANGEPLPGRTTVMKTYGVSDWTARQALKEAKERLQESAETLQKTQEN